MRSILRGWLGGCSYRGTTGWSGVRNDLAVILKLVLAVNHNYVTRVETRADTYVVAGSLGDRNHPNLHSVATRYNVDVRALGSALDRGCGNNNYISLDIDEHVHVDELIREEDVVVVGEYGFELVRAGRGIDLVVDGGEFAVGNFGRVVAIVGLDGEQASATDFDQDLLKLVLRQVKMTEIGCSWVMTRSPVVSVACTMFPISTRRNPTRPLIGAVMRE